MLKKILIGILFLALALAACEGTGQTGTPKGAPSNGGTAVPETRRPGCTVKTRQETPNPTQEALLPPPNDKDWSRGPADAYVTFIEYSDFQ